MVSLIIHIVSDAALLNVAINRFCFIIFLMQRTSFILSAFYYNPVLFHYLFVAYIRGRGGWRPSLKNGFSRLAYFDKAPPDAFDRFVNKTSL